MAQATASLLDSTGVHWRMWKTWFTGNGSRLKAVMTAQECGAKLGIRTLSVASEQPRRVIDQGAGQPTATAAEVTTVLSSPVGRTPLSAVDAERGCC